MTGYMSAGLKILRQASGRKPKHRGKSIAGYLRRAVEERMTRDGVELPRKNDEEETEKVEP